MNEIFTATKDSRCLRTFVDSSGEGALCFEVKDGEKLLYRGTSFEKARETYEGLIPEARIANRRPDIVH